MDVPKSTVASATKRKPPMAKIFEAKSNDRDSSIPEKYKSGIAAEIYETTLTFIDDFVFAGDRFKKKYPATKSLKTSNKKKRSWV